MEAAVGLLEALRRRSHCFFSLLDGREVCLLAGTPAASAAAPMFRKLRAPGDFNADSKNNSR
jgi:hypothetical protein